MNYLEEAAALLRKASDINDRENASYPALRRKAQMEIAEAFARLAAIERGLVPADLLTEALRAATGVAAS